MEPKDKINHKIKYIDPETLLYQSLFTVDNNNSPEQIQNDIDNLLGVMEKSKETSEWGFVIFDDYVVAQMENAEIKEQIGDCSNKPSKKKKKM